MESVAPYQKIVFRDIVPVTPHRYAPKAVVGDDVAIGATLVRDGHGILSARVRWRRTPRTTGPGAVPLGWATTRVQTAPEHS